jgi:His Kinase A (phospho-acceptor) domain
MPLLSRDKLMGALVVRRKAPGAFPQHSVDLLQTFAAQSVLAIQNARVFQEIEEKSRQLELTSQHKSRFVASMSHELRTPLNAIIGLTEMMVSNAPRFGTEKAVEPLRRVHRAGTHLLGLINQVLDLSKIEAGKLELSPETVNLAPLLEDIIGTARQLAEQNKNRLVVESPDNPDCRSHAAKADPAQSVEQCMIGVTNCCGGTRPPASPAAARAPRASRPPYPWQIKHPLARHLLRALVGASIRCLSHKTCQQDRYKNKVEGNLQRDQIRSMARIVHRVADGPKHLK